MFFYPKTNSFLPAALQKIALLHYSTLDHWDSSKRRSIFSQTPDVVKRNAPKALSVAFNKVFYDLILYYCITKVFSHSFLSRCGVKIGQRNFVWTQFSVTVLLSFKKCWQFKNKLTSFKMSPIAWKSLMALGRYRRLNFLLSSDYYNPRIVFALLWLIYYCQFKLILGHFESSYL